jgi:hypothetical protein
VELAGSADIKTAAAIETLLCVSLSASQDVFLVLPMIMEDMYEDYNTTTVELYQSLLLMSFDTKM